MFVQVISGRIADRARLQLQLERWATELRPGAKGFLGSTSGATAGGLFIALARFENEWDARANSDRPEQTAWWEDTEGCFEAPVVFSESIDVEVLGDGGSDDAGFVQVIEGRTTSRARFMDLEHQIEKGFAQERPEFIGSLLVWWGEATWLEAAYFRSEAEARAGEQRRLSDQLSELYSEWHAVANPVSYLDLSEPWLVS